MRTIESLVRFLEASDEVACLNEAVATMADRTRNKMGKPATSFAGLKPPWLPGYWAELKHARKEKRPVAHDTSFHTSLGKATNVLEKEHGIKVGERLGAGRSGAAFEHGSHAGTVVKFDRGDREARLARYTSSSKKLKNGSIIPRYHKVINTGVKDEKTGETIHALHREDIGDLRTKSHSSWHSYGLSVSDTATRLADSGKSHHDYDALSDEIDGHHRKIRPHVPDKERQHFDRFHKGVKKLLRHGIIPCDMHADNLGSRKNGEVVLRDAGCHHRVQFHRRD
jgi:hypothetical protein